MDWKSDTEGCVSKGGSHQGQQAGSNEDEDCKRYTGAAWTRSRLQKRTAREPMPEVRLPIFKSLLTPSGSVNGPLMQLPTVLAIGVMAANHGL